MNPTELEQLITPYLLGDLDAKQSGLVKQLLATDPAADQVRRDAEATLALLDDAFADRELVAKKGLDAKPVLQARKAVTEPLRIPVRLWAHAAGIAILCGCIYFLIQSMQPLVNQQAKVPSFPAGQGEPPSALAAQSPGALGAQGVVAPPAATATTHDWQDFKTGGLRMIDGYAAASEEGFLVLKKDGVFINVSSGLDSGMFMTAERKTDWVREQRAGNRHWILGVSEIDGATHALLTIVPANSDFAANPVGWPANFKMTATDNPAAIAELLLLAASYQPAPTGELSRTNTVGIDIAKHLIASGTVVGISTATEQGHVLKTSDGFDYLVPTLSAEQAKTLAAGSEIDLDL